MLAIQRLARQTGGDVQELQTLYVLEAFLARVAASGHRDDLVLKGGVLLAVFEVRRPTRDIDLQVLGISNDVAVVEALVKEIASLDVEDGVDFDLTSVSAVTIRDADVYAGIRVKLVGALGRSRLTIGIDVNFGDPISPEPTPVTVPPVIPHGRPPVTVLGYPLTMVLAEKIVTAIDRGEANTRWRDFADIYTLIGVHSVQAQQITGSLAELSPMVSGLAEMPPLAQPKWRAWRRRVHREQDLPEDFAEVLSGIAEFADPILNQTGVMLWDPTTRTWRL